MRNTSRTTKQKYRSIFLALQDDAKDFPGIGVDKNGMSVSGIAALADLIGVNRTTLANQINPDHEALPPSFATILDIIRLTQGKSAVFTITRLVGQVPMDLAQKCDCSDEHEIKKYLDLASKTSNLLKHGADAAEDFRFDAGEKKAMLPLLIEVIQVAAHLYTTFNDNE